MTIYFLLGKYADTSVSLKGRNSKKEVVVRVLFAKKRPISDMIGGETRRNRPHSPTHIPALGIMSGRALGRKYS